MEAGAGTHSPLAFIDAASREAINSGRADFYPCYFHQLPAMFDIKSFPVDVAVIHITPPNEYGYCSFGVSIDYIKAACRNTKIIIAEMNDQMPRTMGPENRIHVKELHYIVEVSHPLRETAKPHIGELEKNPDFREKLDREFFNHFKASALG